MVTHRAKKAKEITAFQNTSGGDVTLYDARGIEQVAKPSDWIIYEADGVHHYPCDNATFESLYEALGEPCFACKEPISADSEFDCTVKIGGVERKICQSCAEQVAREMAAEPEVQIEVEYER